MSELNDTMKRTLRLRVFTRWANAQLAKTYGPNARFIRSLAQDLSDGVFLINIAHALWKIPNPQFIPNPAGRDQLRHNMMLAFGMLQSAGMPFANEWIDVEDIIDQNLDSILNLMWMIVSHVYSLYLPIPPPATSLYDRTMNIGHQMVEWCNRRLAESPVRVNDMVVSFRDGMALCHLSHFMRNDSINVTQCSPNTPKESAATALVCLHRFCQVPGTVTADEFTSLPGPDDLCTLTYLVEVLVYYRTKFNRPGYGAGTPLSAQPPVPNAPGCTPTGGLPGAMGVPPGTSGSGIRRGSAVLGASVVVSSAPPGGKVVQSAPPGAAGLVLPAGLNISGLTPRQGATVQVISPGRAPETLQVAGVDNKKKEKAKKEKKDKSTAKKDRKLLGKLTLRGKRRQSVSEILGRKGNTDDQGNGDGGADGEGAGGDQGGSAGFPNAFRSGAGSGADGSGIGGGGATGTVLTIPCPNCACKNRAMSTKTEVECFNCNHKIPVPRPESAASRSSAALSTTGPGGGDSQDSSNSAKSDAGGGGGYSLTAPGNAYAAYASGGGTSELPSTTRSGSSTLLSLTGPPPPAKMKKPSSSTSTKSNTSLKSDSGDSGTAVNKSLGKFAWEIKYEELVMSKKLGRGAFGVVFRGKWRMQTVAVKQILSKKITQKQFDEFYAESELMMSLRPHNNVVQLLGVSVDPSKPLCIVTEYLENGSLYDYIVSDKEYGWDFVLKVLQGVSAGMYHLHCENIIHRDLAARNILLDSQGRAKVADFGLSKQVVNTSDAQQETYFRGAFKYMAPESLSKNTFSEKTDVYSFGIVVWEVITKAAPYSGMDIYAAAKLIKKGIRLGLPEETPENVLALTKACWFINPARRPTFEGLGPFLDDIADDDFNDYPDLPLEPPPLKIPTKKTSKSK